MLILLVANVFNGSKFYVDSTRGVDTNNCAQNSPCKTIKRGMSVTSNGDIVVVEAGTYYEYVSITKSISLISNNAIIDGTGVSGSVTDGLVSITASNSNFEGFTIQNAHMYGVAVFGNSNTIVNNIIHNTQDAGIWMRDGSQNTFQGNELYNSVLKNSVSLVNGIVTCSPSNTAWPSAINSWGAANHNTWSGNYVHDNCGEGIVVYDYDIVTNNTFRDNWSVEVYIDGHLGATVSNNTISDTKAYIPRGSSQAWRSIPYGVGIADEGTCRADNNIITGNSITGVRYGFSFYAYSSCSGVKNTTIEGNTIVNAWEYGFRILSGAHVNSTIKNNIVKLVNAKPLIIQSSAFIVTGNSFSGNSQIFEYNGTAYTSFASWNSIAPGNFWEVATGNVTATPTKVVTIISSSTSTITSTPTITRTATMTVTKTPTSVGFTPTATPTRRCIPVIGTDLNGLFCY